MPGYQRKSVRSKPILGLRPRGDLQRSGAARQRPRPGRDQSDHPRGDRADECRLLPTRPWRRRPNWWIRRDSSCRPHHPRDQSMSLCVGYRQAAPRSASDSRRINSRERLRRDLARTRDASRNNDRAGAGHLTYPDLTACPSCSESTAPPGSLDFMLTSVTNGVAAGRVTASSDVRNWTLGLPVQVTLAAGSPGQLLDVKIGGKQLVAFCNGTSAGQCGA